MDGPAQAVVDALARSLGRGVSVDDPHGAILGHSAQHADVDRARVTSIITREVPPAVRAWQDAHGVATARGPVRVPPNAELGMDARVCVPVRDERGLRAHLWVVEGGHPLDAADLVAVEAAAGRLAGLLPGPVAPDGRREADRLLARVLAGDVTPAAERLGASLGDRVVRAVVVRVVTAERSPTAHPVAVPRSGRLLAAHPDDGRVTALVTGDAPVAPVFDVVRRRVEARGLRAVVGIGDPLSAATIVAGIGEATFAARCAAVDPALPTVVGWSALGPYRDLAGADGTGPSPLAALLDAGGSGPMLLRTLETYLDLAGDAQRTAAALTLHRTSLYYRLGRIGELLAVDLDDGLTRTHLHLALKRRRLELDA